MARGLTVLAEVERLERFAAELESRANEPAVQAAAAQAAATDVSGMAGRS